MKTACIQMDMLFAQPEENFAKAKRLIREAMAGNICRCGTYSRHVEAIQEAAAAIAAGLDHLPEEGADDAGAATEGGN